MNMKHALVAIGMAFAMSMAATPAQALTVITDGGTYDIDSDNLFIGQEVAPIGGGPGSFQVTFNSTTDPISATANAAVTVEILGLFDNLIVEWVSVATLTVLNSATVGSGITSLSTLFASPDNLSQFLRFTYDDSQTGANFNISVTSAIPLPPALLLLLSGIVGIGVLGRRNRKKVAA